MFPFVSAAVEGATKTTSTLDSILNFLVPLAVFGVFGFMVYKNFGTEIDALVAWIKKNFIEAKDKTQQVPINNPYMADGIIIYK